METGLNQESNFEYLSILNFSFKKIKNSNNYVFFSFSKKEKNTIIIKNYLLWKDKYPNFGIIFTNSGILIDCSQIDFDLSLKNNLIEDLYFQFVNNGLRAVKDECINYHL